MGDLSTLVVDGPLLVAIGIALLAGVVSFASPCILPLIPGFVGYLSGMSASAQAPAAATTPAAANSAIAVPPADPVSPADPVPAAAPLTPADPVPPASAASSQGRVLLGTILFVLGFTAVFVLLGVVFAALGARMTPWLDIAMRVMGAFVILLGAAFLGYLPFLQQEARIHMRPRFGLMGAPLLGATFALGWTPCIGPTLAAVLTLSFGGGNPMRGGILAFAYCIGLGLPFIVIALAFTRSPHLLNWVRQHRLAITRTGGIVLILLGLALVTGWWNSLMAWLQGGISGFNPFL